MLGMRTRMGMRSQGEFRSEADDAEESDEDMAARYARYCMLLHVEIWWLKLLSTRCHSRPIESREIGVDGRGIDR